MFFDFPSDFDPQPQLADGVFRISPLTQLHRAPLQFAASDPAIWAGHPAKNRHEPDVFGRYFDFLLSLGSAVVFSEAATDTVIGCSVFYSDPSAPTRLSIGFTFLVRDHWGGATNRRLKALMLDHIYEKASEAWFHIAPTNIRSQMATQRLGAVFTHQSDLNLGTGSQPWRCYCLTQESWESGAKP